MFVNKIRIYIGILSLAAIAGLAGFFIPYLLKLHHTPSYQFLDKVGNKFAEKWKSAFGYINMEQDLESDITESQFSSIFVPIHAKFVNIPSPSRIGTGGALTSWQNYLVLLTHEGKIYFIDRDLRLELSSIIPPYNGFDDYQQASAQAPLNKLDHNFGHFRYNDISYFNDRGREGFLVSYTKFHNDSRCYTNTISRLYLDNSSEDLRVSADQWTDIYQTQPCLPLKDKFRAIEGHMAGGRIAYDDGTVYLASGDYGWDGVYGPLSLPTADGKTGTAVAQDTAADYGKIIAINVETGAARFLSRGHRNTQGIAIDRNSRLWVVEHGVRGGDELNMIVEGENYGWPFESYGTLYSTLPIPTTNSFGRHERYRRPRLAWLPSIAVSGLTRIENFHETWDGDLLVSTLAGKRLARLRIVDERVIFSEFIDIGRRIRHVHQHTDGQIVLWTDSNELIFLSPAEGGWIAKSIDDYLDKLPADKDVVEKIRSTFNSCSECHSLEPGENTNAPSLLNIYNSKTGSTSYKGYSEALLSNERQWTRAFLLEYLNDPQAALPGTLMPNPNISDKEVREGIVDILELLEKSER